MGRNFTLTLWICFYFPMLLCVALDQTKAPLTLSPQARRRSEDISAISAPPFQRDEPGEKKKEGERWELH